MAEGEQAIAALSEAKPDAVLARGSFRDQTWVCVSTERLVDVCQWLRDDPQASFDHLMDVTAVHWPDAPQPMEMVYQLYSHSRNDRVRVKARTGETGPVPTLCGLWQSADWNERETYDMFGIVFAGHPDLRRILMPDDYTDFPLRKELPLYRG